MGALKSCLPPAYDKVSLHEPHFGGCEWQYVKECIDTGWVSSAGKFVDQFETQLVEFTGIRHAIATVNGTAALHTCLLLAGVSSGDEVLMPALTFVATGNAAAYCGAIPHFVDSEEHTLGTAPDMLADYLQDIAEIKNAGCYNKYTRRPIKALTVMHTFGHPADLDPLAELCKRYRITLIEDAAEALGSYYKKQHVGHHGRLTALSFNGNKIITSGGGGAILTQDPLLAKQAKHLTTTAKLPHPWLFLHDQVGYNYRLPNINAALGCAQLEQMPEFLDAKRRLAKHYQAAFAGIDGVKFVTEPENSTSNHWLNALLLDADHVEQRDVLLKLFHEHGILARPVWTLLHKLPMYETCPKMNLPVAEYLEAGLINLPSSFIIAP
ncbi:MAG: LegC family aminotransferase [Gammaproteobacteria bacterium]|nr:LegC family aminotransferase [Gammaproteobacteria bacterium]